MAQEPAAPAAAAAPRAVSAAPDGGLETITSQFVNAMAGGHNVVVTSAKNLTVQRSMNRVSVSYVGQDVNVQGGSALAGQSSWMIGVDTKGTPDPSDDVYTISGTQQGGGNSAGSQNAGLTTIQQDQVAFHAACDGMADIVTTTGSHQTVALNFFR